jgi:phosphatidylglycerophosphate synthase
MQSINELLEAIRNLVRGVINRFARVLNKLTGGKLNPNYVTLFGFAVHVPIALLIARGYFIYAGVLLVVFGLFDALDGSLARLQNRLGKYGQFLDSVTDKMKEAILYLGVAYFFVYSGAPYWAVWAVAACGAGLLVSYINAWGDVVTRDIKKSEETNKAFRGGLMSFDIRMFSLVVGLLTGQLEAVIVIITVLAWVTALERIQRINKIIRHAEG